MATLQDFPGGQVMAAKGSLTDINGDWHYEGNGQWTVGILAGNPRRASAMDVQAAIGGGAIQNGPLWAIGAPGTVNEGAVYDSATYTWSSPSPKPGALAKGGEYKTGVGYVKPDGTRLTPAVGGDLTTTSSPIGGGLDLSSFLAGFGGAGDFTSNFGGLDMDKLLAFAFQMQMMKALFGNGGIGNIFGGQQTPDQSTFLSAVLAKQADGTLATDIAAAIADAAGLGIGTPTAASASLGANAIAAALAKYAASKKTTDLIQALTGPGANSNNNALAIALI